MKLVPQGIRTGSHFTKIPSSISFIRYFSFFQFFPISVTLNMPFWNGHYLRFPVVSAGENVPPMNLSCWIEQPTIIFYQRSLSKYGVYSIIQQNVSGGDRSRASIFSKILKYNTRFFFENLIECSQSLLYNTSSVRKV